MEKIENALRARGRALVVLAGGTTPRNTYRLLAGALTAKGVPSKRLLWLFGDERWVSVDDPQSNEGMARESLLHPIKAPVSTVISWEAGSGEPVDCAMRYAEKARAAMKDGEFDLVFLGVGADGHTASLFPDGDVHLSAGSSRPVGPERSRACRRGFLAIRSRLEADPVSRRAEPLPGRRVPGGG